MTNANNSTLERKISVLFIKTLIILFLMASCAKDSAGDSGSVPNGITKDNNLKPTGESARELLSAEDFDQLHIEVLYVTDMAPTAGSLDNLQNFLEAILNKPGGITIAPREITIANKAAYAIPDILEIEDQNREAYNADKTIAITALFLNGEYAGNTPEGSVLGIAYRNTSFVIFEATIREFSEQVFAPSLTTLESTVIQHEVGHLLGLVNNGTPLQTSHQDAANGAHCEVDGCLMFWQAETGEGLLNMLSGGTVAQLDAQCRADLSANGGK